MIIALVDAYCGLKLVPAPDTSSIRFQCQHRAPGALLSGCPKFNPRQSGADRNLFRMSFFCSFCATLKVSSKRCITTSMSVTIIAIYNRNLRGMDRLMNWFKWSDVTVSMVYVITDIICANTIVMIHES